MEEKDAIKVECPHCKNAFLAQKIERPGKYKTICPHCKKEFVIDKKMPAANDNKEKAPETGKTFPVPYPVDFAQGELVWWSRLFIRKRYRLKEGSNIVGRKIPGDVKTDLQLDDPFVSAHSVDIGMHTDSHSTRYVLCVLRKRNPVLLNGCDRQVGEEIVLRFGDTIKLGKTKLTLKRLK